VSRNGAPVSRPALCSDRVNALATGRRLAPPTQRANPYGPYIDRKHQASREG